MELFTFKAFAFGGELDLNRLAVKLGITRKYRGNPEADRLYLTMASQFELNQRYQEIKHKSETLLDMTDVFTGLSHARRSARLEWIIIILIAIEIVIYLMQLSRGI